MGRDPGCHGPLLYALDFNPRAPCGARRRTADQTRFPAGFQSTRPVWGATSLYTASWMGIAISIHAPRVGRDEGGETAALFYLNFNPRAPCGARRPFAVSWTSQTADFNPRAPCGARLLPACICCIGFSPFQSTRPVWGATQLMSAVPRLSTDFNPRAPCGARPECLRMITKNTAFQSTRPVWGATMPHPSQITLSLFQSTRPVWGATSALQNLAVTLVISIHAPRVGRDPYNRQNQAKLWQFQSTRPVWGATMILSAAEYLDDISIHAPRVGRDIPDCSALWQR